MTATQSKADTLPPFSTVHSHKSLEACGEPSDDDDGSQLCPRRSKPKRLQAVCKTGQDATSKISFDLITKPFVSYYTASSKAQC